MPSNPFAVPPGLHGDYTGSCIVCLQGTDSGIALRGEAEWIIVGISKLGVPEDQAKAIVSLDCDPGMVPDGVLTNFIRVCADCAARAGAPTPGLLAEGSDVPLVRQPGVEG